MQCRLLGQHGKGAIITLCTLVEWPIFVLVRGIIRQFFYNFFNGHTVDRGQFSTKNMRISFGDANGAQQNIRFISNGFKTDRKKIIRSSTYAGVWIL